MNKKWECYEIDENKVKDLSEKYNLKKNKKKILVNKGITKKEEIEVFLNPTRKDFHNPFLMPDMEKAVDRIMKAIEESGLTMSEFIRQAINYFIESR